MSFVIANPEMLAAAATDLAGIRSAISAATAAAAAPTIQVAAAGADEVSLAISALFGQHAQAYQALSAQATIFHDQFVQALTSGGNLYAAAESHTVEQMVLNAINAPTQTLFGRPLIGDGANGTAENPDGQNGGLLPSSAPPTDAHHRLLAPAPGSVLAEFTSGRRLSSPAPPLPPLP